MGNAITLYLALAGLVLGAVTHIAAKRIPRTAFVGYALAALFVGLACRLALQDPGLIYEALVTLVILAGSFFAAIRAQNNGTVPRATSIWAAAVVGYGPG